MAKNKLLDLLKKLGNSTVLKDGRINKTDTRPRRIVTPAQPEIQQPQSRPRYVQEPSQADKLKQESSWLSADESHGRGGSILRRPSRLKAGLLGLLAGAGAGANRALEQGQGWEGLGQALGGGIGGAAVHAADPGIIMRARHGQAVQENQQDLDREMQQMGNEAQLENLKAISEGKRADAEYQRAAPLREQARREAQAEHDAAVLKIRQDSAAGRLTISQASQKLRELELEERKRHNLETEKISGQAKTSTSIDEADSLDESKEHNYNEANKARQELAALQKRQEQAAKDQDWAAHQGLGYTIADVQRRIARHSTEGDQAGQKAGQLRAKGRSSPSSKMGLSRRTFRANNPSATKGRSDQEVDAMITNGGFAPTP